MISIEPDPIDLKLVDEVLSRVPTHTWALVKLAIVEAIVDNMPSDVLLRLTNDPEGFTKAEEILFDYYFNTVDNQRLIIDAFNLIGDQATLCILEGLNLDQVVEFVES